MIGQGFSHDLTDSVPEVDGTHQQRKELTLPELKQRLSQWQEDVFKLETRARKEWDPSTAAVFREIYFWSFQTKDPDQWLWKTYEKWWEDHGLTKAMVRTAVRKLLKAGVIDKKNGLGNRMYFRLMPARVIEVLYSDKEAPSDPHSEVSNQDFCGATSRHLTSSYDSSHRREEEEKKKESGTAPAGASAHTPSNSSSKAKNHVSDDNRDRGGRAATQQKAGKGERSDAENVVESLGTGLRKHGFDLTSKQHRSYVAQAQELIADGVRRKEMGAILRRVVERWESYRAMPLRTAREDVQRKKASAERNHDPMRDGFTEEEMRVRYGEPAPRGRRHNLMRDGYSEQQMREFFGHSGDEKPSPSTGEEEIPITEEDLCF